MKFLWNGEASGSRTLFKNANGGLHHFRFINDAGTAVVNTTSSTMTLELYADVKRSAAAVASLSLNDTAVANELTSGYQKEELLQAVMNFGPGTYFAFAKYVNGSVTDISTNYFTVVIR